MAKPRPIGNRAKQDLVDIDMDLASSDKFLDPIVEGEKMLQTESSLRATMASRAIRQARLRIANLLAYADATAPTTKTRPTSADELAAAPTSQL